MVRINSVKTLFFLYFVFAGTFSFSAYWQVKETSIKKHLKQVSLTNKKSGIKGIDCIYVINLDKKPERFARIQKAFNRVGVKLNRVSGIEGKLLTLSQKAELVGPYPVRLRDGEYGCLLSHLSAIFDAYKRKFSRVWILEDDAEIVRKVKTIQKFLTALEKKDSNWDVFYTDKDSRDHNGWLIPKEVCPRPDQKIKKAKFIKRFEKLSLDILRVKSRWGTYSYLISRKGLKKITSYFSHVFLWSPIDCDIHLIPGIREYVSRKDIVTHPRSREGSDTTVSSICKNILVKK